MRKSDGSVRFPALGSTAIVAVSDRALLKRARAAVEQTVQCFDDACSRFRDDSELSALNAAAGTEVRVSPLLLDAVSAAVRAARLTDGDVDPTVGRALIALGYDKDFGSIGTPPSFTIESVPGWQTVELDLVASTVRIARGVALDLGATAKALAADRAAAAAHTATGCGVLVSLGGDIALAGAAPPEGWEIRVTDDHASGVHAPGQWITLRSGGLATSSTTARHWRAGSEQMHHLVDPATGRPAAIIWRTVSVSAASCLDANIATTAAIVRGERAAPWLESLGLPSRLVSREGSVRHVAGWPVEHDDLTPDASGHQVPA
jgi:thiamine biosynthesis lipoprotein